MFNEGDIILCTPFYFKNGEAAKNKYFIILKNISLTSIIASLPTSIDKIPSSLSQTHGCINQDDRCFNCYLFKAGISICDNGFSFPLHTHIYGNEIEDYELSIIQSIYIIEGIDFEKKGTLLKSEFEKLVSCLKNSSSVKRKIRKLL